MILGGILRRAWGWVTGGRGVPGLLDRLQDVQSRLDGRMTTTGPSPETERLRIEASLIEREIASRQAARERSAGFWEMRLLTFMIAAPFVLHAAAVGLDTTLTFVQWNIPAYPPPFDEWEAAILLSFFGINAGLTGVRMLTDALSRRRA